MSRHIRWKESGGMEKCLLSENQEIADAAEKALAYEEKMEKIYADDPVYIQCFVNDSETVDHSIELGGIVEALKWVLE